MKKTTKRKRILASLAFLGLAAISPAFAFELKQDVTVYEDIVYAKDLLENVGDYGFEPLFLSPDPGKTGRISARRILEQAEEAGIYNVNANNIATVVVKRPSLEITPEVISRALNQKAQTELGENVDFDLITSALPALTHADIRPQQALRIQNFSLKANANLFEAEAEIKTYSGVVRFPVRGQIIRMKTLPVVIRDIERGEILSAADIMEKRVPIDKIRTGSVEDGSLITGKAAVRRLTASSIVRAQDLEEPVVVQSNDQISITYRIPGLILSAQGRALDSGPIGASISVMNTDSKRIVRATITNSGEVTIDPRVPLITAENSTPATR